MFLILFLNYSIICHEAIVLKTKDNKFVITPKGERSVTFTVRLESEIISHIEEISLKSGRSRNELINKALQFAIDNLEFDSDNSK